jgi:hypothetical protein
MYLRTPPRNLDAIRAQHECRTDEASGISPPTKKEPQTVAKAAFHLVPASAWFITCEEFVL